MGSSKKDRPYTSGPDRAKPLQVTSIQGKPGSGNLMPPELAKKPTSAKKRTKSPK